MIRVTRAAPSAHQGRPERVREINAEVNMFETSKTPEGDHWPTNAQRGLVVLLRFPLSNLPSSEARTKQASDLVPRPCLLTEIVQRAGKTFLELAPGTFVPRYRHIDHVVLKSRRSIMSAGVHAPIGFDLSRKLLVAPTHRGFDHMDTVSPVLGMLSLKDLERMNGIRARQITMRDILAEMHRADAA
jgi:hypothetical protein